MKKNISIICCCAALICLTATFAFAEQYNADGWPILDVKTAALVKGMTVKNDIVSVCPGVDVEQKLYIINVDNVSPRAKEAYGISLPPGSIVRFMTNTLIANGQLAAIYMDRDGNHPMDIAVVDENGDGVFRMKYEEEKFAVPQWIMDACQ